MKYYIAENGQQVGPMEENELLSHGMTINTLVWREGMAQWMPAGQVAELAYIFNNGVPPVQPPQIPNQQPPQPQYGFTQQNRPPMPKTWLVESILVTLFCCLPFGIVGIIKSSGVSSAYYSGNYDMAEEASASAKKWTLIGFWIGVAGIILYILFYLIMGASFFSLSESYSY